MVVFWPLPGFFCNGETKNLSLLLLKGKCASNSRSPKPFQLSRPSPASSQPLDITPNDRSEEHTFPEGQWVVTPKARRERERRRKGEAERARRHGPAAKRFGSYTYSLNGGHCIGGRGCCRGLGLGFGVDAKKSNPAPFAMGGCGLLKMGFSCRGAGRKIPEMFENFLSRKY